MIVSSRVSSTLDRLAFRSKFSYCSKVCDQLVLVTGLMYSTRTVTVGVKNLRKATLRKALNALIRMLQANYPDDYKHRIREWGFQKEKY